MEYINASELKRLKEPKLILKSIDEDRGKINGRRKRVATVYLADPTRPGPFGNGQGDLLDEFAWRRSNAAPVAPKIIKEFLSPILQEKEISRPLKVSWSRYAGCGMCPCSPGYVVTTGEHPWQHYTIYLGQE